MAITDNELPPTVALAGNPMWADIETDEHAEDFIGLHLDPEVYLDSAWQSAAQEMRFEPDSDHKAVVDLSKILQWDPEQEFTFPENCGTLLIKRNNLRRQWRLTRSEKYGNPLAEYSAGVAAGTRYILPGKISNKKFGQYNDAGTNWWTKLQSDKSFLTNSPRTKTTDAWAAERLYYLSYSAAATSINLNIRVTYSDGTTTVITRETITGVAQYDVYEIITSFSSLGIILLDQSKTISKYEIWLTNQSSATLSEIFTYKMDHVKKPHARYFIFSNAYKMYEGLRFTGKSKESAAISSISGERELVKGYGVIDRSILRDLIDESHNVSANSGWLTTDELNLYREMLLSKEVYEIIGGVIIPVVINNNEVLINDDQSNLKSVELQYQYAYSDSVPDIHDSIDDDSDSFSAGSDLLTSFNDYSIDTFNYTSGSITFVDGITDDGYANSNSLSRRYVPLIIIITNYSSSIGNLEASLHQAGTSTDRNELDPVAMANKHDILYSTYNGNIALTVRKIGANDNVTVSLDCVLKVASKRYLEYIYENNQ